MKVCLLLLCLLAVEAVRAEPAKAACVWRAKGPRAVVYLVGSLHMLPKEEHPLPAIFEEVYAKADKLFFEVPMAEANAPEMQAKVMQLAMYPEGKNLRTELDNETHKALLKTLKTTKETKHLADVAGTIRAGFLVMMLAQAKLAEIGARSDLGLEQFYHRRAVKDGKPTDGLESVEFQIGLFAGLTRKEETILVDSSLQGFHSLKEDYQEMVEAWREGQAEKLAKIINEQFEVAPSLREKLLLKRNQTWIPQIEAMLQGEQTIMLVVGAGHLAGQGNVRELLAKKGIECQPVVPGKETP